MASERIVERRRVFQQYKADVKERGKPFSVSRVDGTGASAKIHKWKLSFPGEPVSGLESWLYPIQPPH